MNETGPSQSTENKNPILQNDQNTCVKTIHNSFNQSPLYSFATRELKTLGYKSIDQEEDGPNKWIQENVLELLEVFAKQGHSGSSAPHAISLFTKLASYLPLSPLTGEDHEWKKIGDGEYQNIRCSSVFKKGENVYDINGKIFKEPSGACYTSNKSRVSVTFPYIPTPKYVNVDIEGNEI